jgi:DNA-binding MarR family transcriptional regulator
MKRRPIHGLRAHSRPVEAPPLRDTTFATEEFIPYLLNQVVNSWNRDFKSGLKRSPVNVRQWRVLAVLCRKPDLSLTELIQETAIDQPTLSRMVDQLSLLGLLKREIAKDDARYLRLRLTPKGQALVEEVWPIAWKHYRKGVAGLTAEEEALLSKFLQRIFEALQAG